MSYSYNKEKWDEFCEKYKGKCGGFEKYFDIEEQIKFFTPILTDLRIYDYKCDGIPRTGFMTTKQLSILDISTGFGVFPWMCQQLGHRVTYTDAKRTEQSQVCYDAQIALGLHDGIEYDFHVKDQGDKKFGYRPIPYYLRNFNRITAFSSSPMSHWNTNDWDLFLQDCCGHLQDTCDIVLVLPNRGSGQINLWSFVSSGRFPNGWSPAFTPYRHGYTMAKGYRGQVEEDIIKWMRKKSEENKY